MDQYDPLVSWLRFGLIVFSTRVHHTRRHRNIFDDLSKVSIYRILYLTVISAGVSADASTPFSSTTFCSVPFVIDSLTD